MGIRVRTRVGTSGRCSCLVGLREAEALGTAQQEAGKQCRRSGHEIKDRISAKQGTGSEKRGPTRANPAVI